MSEVSETLTLHEALAPLHYLTRLLFIRPFRFQNGKLSKLTKIDKLLAAVLINLFFAYIFCSIYGKISIFCNVPLRHIPCVFDIIFTLPTHILIMISVIMGNFRNGKAVLLFYKNLATIDAQYFIRQFNYSNLRKRIIIDIVICYTAATVISTPDVYFIVVHMGVYKASFILCLNLTYYMTLAIVMQIIIKVRLLRQRFEALNKRLMIVQTYDSTKSSLFLLSTKPLHLRRLCRAHLKLCNLIKVFNKIHGLEVALIYSSVTFLILLCLNVTLWSEDFLHMIPEDFRIVIRLLKGFSAMMYLFPVLALSKTCSDARKSARKIGNVAQKLLLDAEETVVKEELEFIAIQVLRTDTNFSASGLFVIDWTAVYSVLGTVTSYFIVLLQFKGVSQ